MFQNGSDPNLTSKSYLTENRRRYPRDRDGSKNEWHAIVQHQTLVNNQITQFEKELKHLRAQQLGQAYDQKLQEHIQMKEAQLAQKQADAQLMREQINQYQNDLVRQKTENHQLHNYLLESNSNIQKDHQMKSNEEKQKKLETEIQQLEENRRRIESEQKRRLNAKIEMNHLAHEQLNNHFEKKTHDKQDQLKFRDEFNQMVQKNIQRDIMKEENYKNFYKMAADRQSHLGQLHAENVYTDQQKREQMLTNTINKNVTEAELKAQEKEALLRQRREEIQNNLKSTLNYQVGYKNQLKQQEREMKQVESEDVAKKAQEYNQYLQEVKNQQLASQQHYREMLAKQHQEWEQQNKSNKMTKQEKKLNFMDLQAYKSTDAKLDALVPGIQHSKYEFGGSPALKSLLNTSVAAKNTLANGSNNYTNQTIQTQPTEPANVDYFSSKNKNNSLVINPLDSNVQPRQIIASPTYRTSSHNILSNQINNKYISPSPLRNVLSPKMGNPTQGNDNIFYSPPPLNPEIKRLQINSPTNQSLNLAPRKNLSLVTSPSSGSHNPITNPMPYNNQNPYILRDLVGAKSRSEKGGYIANVVSANLFTSQAQSVGKRG